MSSVKSVCIALRYASRSASLSRRISRRTYLHVTSTLTERVWFVGWPATVSPTHSE